MSTLLIADSQHPWMPHVDTVMVLYRTKVEYLQTLVAILTWYSKLSPHKQRKKQHTYILKTQAQHMGIPTHCNIHTDTQDTSTHSYTFNHYIHIHKTYTPVIHTQDTNTFVTYTQIHI